MKSCVERYLTLAESVLGQRPKLPTVPTPFLPEDNKDAPSGKPSVFCPLCGNAAPKSQSERAPSAGCSPVIPTDRPPDVGQNEFDWHACVSGEEARALALRTSIRDRPLDELLRPPSLDRATSQMI